MRFFAEKPGDLRDHRVFAPLFESAAVRFSFARQGFLMANTSTNAAAAIAKSSTKGAKYEPVERNSAAAAVAENDENSSLVFEML